jgi:hypothetical protein
LLLDKDYKVLKSWVGALPLRTKRI